jgi:hypothetical protein
MSFITASGDDQSRAVDGLGSAAPQTFEQEISDEDDSVGASESGSALQHRKHAGNRNRRAADTTEGNCGRLLQEQNPSHLQFPLSFLP